MSRPVRADDQAEVASSGKQDKSGSVYEFIKVVVQAGLIALVVRTFLFQPFNIPSGSLMPTLLVGDYLFVSKYAYGYSKYSFPFSPNLFSGRFWGSYPKRGDIAVFKYPNDNYTDYIKRVIGLPGDTIRVTNGYLSIQSRGEPDKRAELEFVRDYVDDKDGRHAYVYNETLPSGYKHEIQLLDHRAGTPGLDLRTEGLWKVEDGSVFMMGDNRDASSDSRFWGAAPLENLEGRAELVFFSIKTKPGPQTTPEPETEPIWQLWRWPWTVRWDRLFTRVH